jgi:hypothetical protein
MFVLRFELFVVMEKHILCDALWTIVGRVIPRLYQLKLLLKWHFYKVQSDSNSNFIFSHFYIIGVLQFLLQRRSGGKCIIKVMSKQHWKGEKNRLSKSNKQKAASDDQAAVAREKHRLAMKNQRQEETDEQAALAREKHRLAMKNQCQAETDEQTVLAREKDRLSKCNKHKAETDEQAALANENDRLSKKNQCQAETDEQAALARGKHRLAMSNKCQVESHEQAALAMERNELAKGENYNPEVKNTVVIWNM